MAPLDPDIRRIVDDVANALQAVGLIAEHLQRSTSCAALDASAMIRILRRVKAPLERLRKTGGAL